jgi:hypothetical protein
MLKTGDELRASARERVRRYREKQTVKISTETQTRKNWAIHYYIPSAGSKHKENIMKIFQLAKHAEYQFGEYQVIETNGGQNG